MTTTRRWPDAVYAALEAVLRRRAGLVFQALRRAAVEKAAWQVMHRIGVDAPESFLPLVDQDGAVFDDLMAAVTVGETYFFREAQHFALLRERVLPEFRAKHGPDRRFRAWSAAASTGEEAYSIAIALLEEDAQADVLGTDISRARLASARHATYRRWSFRGVPQQTIDRYFTTTGKDYTLVPAVRRAVEFRYLNLAADSYPAMSSGVWGMDVIFCRNVLIYFDRDTIAHVAESLIASIADDGWIFLGATDPPLSDYVRCEVIQTASGLVYRRPRSGRPAVLRPAPVSPPLPKPAPVPAPADRPSPKTQAGTARALADVRGDAAAVRLLANAGRLEEAGRLCAAALDRQREDPELHYLHAVLVAQAGQFTESARAARRALYLDRSMIVAHLVLGTSLMKSGDIDGGRRAFANAERLLAQLTAETIVPFSGGEPAGRLLEMTRMQSQLARGDAA